MKKGNGVWLSIGFLSERRLAVSFERVREYCHIYYSDILLWSRRSRSKYPSSAATSNDFIRY